MNNYKRSNIVPRQNGLILWYMVVMVVAYRLMWIVPWAQVRGSYDILDVALMLVLLAFCYSVIKVPIGSKLNNAFSVLFLGYMAWQLVPVVLARFNYNQTLFDGILATRQQFFYLIFFIFLFLVKHIDVYRKLLNLISGLAFIGALICLINYFGPTIIYHEKTEWESIRSGIERIYFPAIPLIAMAYFWHLAKMLATNKITWIDLFLILFYFGSQILNQSRGTIIGTVVATGLLLLKQQHYKLIALMAAAAVAGVIVLGAIMEENILIKPFETAVEDIEENEGTWGSRVSQMETGLAIFKEHPLIGSGTSAIRLSIAKGGLQERYRLFNLSRSEDLGYPHWIKHYGLVGVAWLLAFLYFFYRRSAAAYKYSKAIRNPLGYFAYGYTIYVIVTLITLNHLMISGRVILLMLVCAMIMHLSNPSFLRKSMSGAITRGRVDAAE